MDSPTLRLPPEVAFLPVAKAFAEHSARVCGLGQPEALALALATEELFVFLCDLGLSMQIRSIDGTYYTQLEFAYRSSQQALQAMDQRKLNLTFSVDLDDEDDLANMGLLLATRSVDSYRVDHARAHETVITVRKYKRYPEITGQADGPAENARAVDYREPSPEELSLFCRRVTRDYDPLLYHTYFRSPGMVVDMVASGDYKALVAVDERGDPVGGILLDRQREALTLAEGPFLFGQPASVARGLLEAALSLLARTSVQGLVFDHPTPDLPASQMEELGRRRFCDAQGRVVELSAWYRQLAEDNGRVCWSDEGLRHYLEAEYERLVLPRDIRLAPPAGSSRTSCSVIEAAFDRLSSRVTLRAVLAGEDISESLARHLTVLRREGWRNIFFDLDLGRSWQVPFAASLRTTGFSPRMILPGGGVGDVVVFQAPEDQP